ncbi:MAG TPA: glutamate-cysteine ligase family protein [Myxococcota bacterium]|nr:glutamate-cysteine ligase family protein [Myxococcota bacterium]
MTDGRLGLFAAYGIEIEYAIVDAATLDVRPLADALFEAEAGEPTGDALRGRMAWSNELARHVVELKTAAPEPRLVGLADLFAAEVRQVESRLAPLGARLMPTGMHPWMDPSREFALWPHGERAIYEAFDRIFDCRGHGWANLQSAHLNLPFDGDDEFGRLHAAVRALLPLLPALAASSPFVEGRHAGWLDARLDVYRSNAARVPSVSGDVVPEPVFTRAGYDALLERIYADLAPLDPEGTLRNEWVNARGCIARFDRDAIEIRVLDAQECPRADLAIAGAVAAAVRALCESERQGALRALDTKQLSRLLFEVAHRGGAARIDDAGYLAALGIARDRCRASEVWELLVARHLHADALAAPERKALAHILAHGCLAERILEGAGEAPSRDILRAVYAELCDCLRENRPYGA